MKQVIVFLFVVVLLGAACSQKTASAPTRPDKQPTEQQKSAAAVTQAKVPASKTVSHTSAFAYPPAPRGTVVDTYFGVQVADPYRWLEQNEDPKVQQWTADQNKLTETTIDSWPETDKIANELKKVWNYDKMMTPVSRGEKLFYRMTKGLQNQPVLYLREGETEKVLVDPNKLSDKGTVAMDWWYVSPKGTFVVYGLSENGSEQSVLHILKVADGSEVDTPIPGCRYASVGWLPDESGFFYTRKLDGKNPNEIDVEQSVRFHTLGENPEKDRVIQKAALKEAILVSSIDNQGKWLLLTEYKGSSGKAKVWLYDILKKQTKVLVDNYDDIWEGGIYNGTVYLKTAHGGALNWKIVAFDATTGAMKEVIPADDTDVIDSFVIANHRILVSYMHDVASHLFSFALDGTDKKEISLPTLGSVHAISGEGDEKYAFISFSSYGYPPSVFRYDGAELTRFWQAKVDVKTDDIVTEQVFYTSKDGTKIPMFIVHKKGCKKDGNNPLMLKGYGGFNVTYPLYFSASNIVWIANGGVLAIANIRGGGEYGEKWHKAGMLDKKQNVFDDFAYAMKYLAEHKWTSPDKLAIWGGSNGGLLTGAMVVQHPQLFRAALVAVPLLDMLRFHKFLIGRYWVSEYGSSDSEEQFKYLLKYSPYHNVKKGTPYPSVLLTAGEHDSRVHPLHAKKMAAALQWATSSHNPIFLWVETTAGHGQGKSTDARIRETARELGFFLHEIERKQ